MKIVGRVAFLLLVAVGGLVLARTARAGETTTPGMPPVRLVLAPVPPDDRSGLALDRLRAGLEAELGRPVSVDDRADESADVLTMIYAPARGELSVIYKPDGGRLVIRTVRAPGPADEVAALAVLLAGNVARDQASELLGPPREQAAPAPAAAVEVLATRAGGPVRTQSDKPGLLERIQVKPVLWSGSLGLANMGASFSDGNGYVLVNMAAHLELGARMLGPGLAVGARIPLQKFACQSDVGLTYLYGLDWYRVPGSYYGYTNDRLITRARTALAFSPFQGFEVFAGVALAVTTHLFHVPDTKWGPELFGGFTL